MKICTVYFKEKFVCGLSENPINRMIIEIDDHGDNYTLGLGGLVGEWSNNDLGFEPKDGFTRFLSYCLSCGGIFSRIEWEKHPREHDGYRSFSEEYMRNTIKALKKAGIFNVSPQPYTPDGLKLLIKQAGLSRDEIASTLNIARRRLDNWCLPFGSREHRDMPADLWAALSVIV